VTSPDATEGSRGLDARIVVNRPGGFRLDVALAIAGENTVALLGPNGAGKSTVVAALAGLLPIDEGHIVLDGRMLDDPDAGALVPPEDRGVGVVFQDYVLFPHLTALDNVAFGLRSRGIDRATARSGAADMMERFGVADLADRRPAGLSGGQAQRVALARALVVEPALLLLDEPLAALDVTTRVSLRRTLAHHLAAFPGPRLLITHDPTEAFLLADEVHVIEDGSVTQVGTADEIRLRPKTPYVADLAGSNLLEGVAAAGIVDVGGHRIHIADHAVSGPVLATLHPRAVAIHLQAPEGSPRNVWRTTVVLVERLGERVRVQVGEPLPLTVEITADALAALDLRPGKAVWLSVKATEITVEPDGAEADGVTAG